MAWRIVVQPNGKYARFSDVVDNFTDYDMTRYEALDLCGWFGRYRATDANEKVANAEADSGRFDRELETVKLVHGQDEADNVRRLLSE